MATFIQTNKPYKELLKIAGPIILGQVGVILVSFIDNMMVGHYDTNHFAAASFVNNLFALIYVLGIGFAYGLTPLVTTAWTQRRAHKAGALLRLSLSLNLVLASISLVIMGGVYAGLEHFDLAPELLPIVRPYFLIQLCCFVLYMAFNAFKQFFDGVGETALGMWIILGTNALNVGLNWLLIYGNYGFPEWGLTGAGLATLAARLVAVIAVVLCFVGIRRYAVSLGGFRWRYMSWRNVSRLIRLGVPMGMYSGMETASFTIALLLVTTLGTLPLAVHQILCVVTTIGFFIYYGFGAATTILVSRYRTLGDMQGVSRSVSVGLELCLASALIAMSVMFLSRDFIAYLFTTDAEIVQMASLALLPVILYQVGDAVQVLYANALRGMEDVNRMAVYSLLVHLLLEPALAYTFGFKIGLKDPTYQLMGIWFAFPIGLGLLGLLFRHRFRQITRAVA